MPSAEIQHGSIVQITDQSHPWCGCILIVDEAGSGFVMAAALVPRSNEKRDISEAWIRLNKDQVELVGHATLWRWKQ